MSETANDKVLIRHPKLPQSEPATTTREAFEGVWKGKGFEIVTPPGETTTTEAAPTTETPSANTPVKPARATQPNQGA